MARVMLHKFSAMLDPTLVRRTDKDRSPATLILKEREFTVDEVSSPNWPPEPLRTVDLNGEDITWTIETSDPTEFATVRGAERLQERWILSKSRLPASLQGIKASSA
jgi:hypothetical protein